MDKQKNLPEGSEEYFLGGKKMSPEQELLLEKARFSGFLNGIFMGVFGMVFLMVIISKAWF